jgi:thymidylate synthase (FAD)
VNTAELRVRLIAATHFDASEAEEASGGRWVGSPWDSDADALAEFAGRTCYQSFGKPNPATAENADYLAHIVESEHFSVMEHASMSLYVTGVSRSLLLELERHRHLSFSVLSQRYVNESDAAAVVPPDLFRTEDTVIGLNLDAVQALTGSAYDVIAERLTQLHGFDRKAARSAARAVLPNMTETRLVVSGNHRTWREVIAKRSAPGADAEIRRFAAEVLRIGRGIAPATFADFPEDGE